MPVGKKDFVTISHPTVKTITLPEDISEYISEDNSNMNEQELRKLYERIVKDCLEIAVKRGHEYNKDGNMIGSYQEYGIDDIMSIIKVKAIRVKNNPGIAKREMPDIINYSCEILRRLNPRFTKGD